MYESRWFPVTILAGTSTKEETGPYRTENFLNQSKAGILVGGVPLLTRALTAYACVRADNARFGPITLLGDQDALAPHVPKHLAALVKIVDTCESLADKIRHIAANGSTMGVLAAGDITPTERDLTTLLYAIRKHRDAPAVVPVIAGEDLILHGFRDGPGHKLYPARGEQGIELIAFPQLYGINPELLELERIAKLTEITFRDREHGLRGRQLIRRISKIVRPLDLLPLGKVLWGMSQRPDTTGTYRDRWWRRAPTYAQLARAVAPALTPEGRTRGAIALRMHAPSLAMDIDCARDLRAVEAYLARDIEAQTS